MPARGNPDELRGQMEAAIQAACAPVVASLDRSIAICDRIIAMIEQMRRHLAEDDDPPAGFL
jgi:hypothetical protein